MNNTPQISASLMCMDPFFFPDILRTLKETNVDYFHIDVMDGRFVPNLGIGTDFVRKLRQHTTIPFDFHLMVEAPDAILDLLDIQPDDIVSVHYECSYQIQRTLEKVKRFNPKVFVALNPATPIHVLEELLVFIDGINLLTVNPGFAGQQFVSTGFSKAQKLAAYLTDHNATHLGFQVDGNINFENGKKLRACGADIFVAGTSSIFGNNDLKESVRQFQQLLKNGTLGT